MIHLIPKRTIAACACTLGAGAGASAALAAEKDTEKRNAAKRPVVDALVPVVDEQLVPPSGQPTKGLQDRYLKLHKEARKDGVKPGRNVVKDGVKERDGDVRLASARDVKKSVRVLKRMTAPTPTEAGSSTQPQTPAGGSGGGASSSQLEAIASCESGGDAGAVGGGGAYRGKYQFSPETWASVGGSGDPAAASEAEQDQRAAQLLARDGAGHWPSCGQ